MVDSALAVAMAPCDDDGTLVWRRQWILQSEHLYLYPYSMSQKKSVSVSNPYNVHLPKQYPSSSNRRPLLFFHSHHRQSHRMSGASGIIYLLGRESPFLPPVISCNDDIPPSNICSPILAPRYRRDRVSECKPTSFLSLPNFSSASP